MGTVQPHICVTSRCDCGMSRRDFLKFSAITSAALAMPLLHAGDVYAKQFSGDDMPVKIGYLPITDATPLLAAHALGLYETEGLTCETPRLFRTWAQIVEAFVSGQINVIHLLAPATLWVRYGAHFPAKIVAWNHTNGSALTVANSINHMSDFAGKTVAVPFWYSMHNILLQQLLRDNNLVPITNGRTKQLADNEVRLIVQPPAEMISALASGAIAGFIVAEPFNAIAESKGIGKALRFSGDIWKDHACCVTFLSERDIEQRPIWAQKVTTALVKAQLWVKDHPEQTAALLSNTAKQRYSPHDAEILQRVFSDKDYLQYQDQLAHPQWQQRRIDFQPYPYPSYTEQLVRSLQTTQLEGNNAFLAKLEPSFVAQDLVDDRFVRSALEQVGGLSAFGLPESFSREETISL